MTQIRFYHLTTQSLAQALPVIVTKAITSGKRIVVRFKDETDVKLFDDLLWTYRPESFLPHGTSKDEHPALQPVYLTTTSENPNNANMLVVCNIQTVPENINGFDLICDFLDGNDEAAVDHGRTRYKAYKNTGHDLTYWQQTNQGGWEQKG